MTKYTLITGEFCVNYDEEHEDEMYYENAEHIFDFSSSHYYFLIDVLCETGYTKSLSEVSYDDCIDIFRKLRNWLRESQCSDDDAEFLFLMAGFARFSSRHGGFILVEHKEVA